MKECQQVYFIIPPEHQVHTLQERYAADGFYCSHKGNTVSIFVVSAQLVTVSITCVVIYCGTVQYISGRFYCSDEVNTVAVTHMK